MGEGFRTGLLIFLLFSLFFLFFLFFFSLRQGKESGLSYHKGYEYSRTNNPTRAAFEQAIASAEGGKHGASCASPSSAPYARHCSRRAHLRVFASSSSARPCARARTQVWRSPRVWRRR